MYVRRQYIMGEVDAAERPCRTQRSEEGSRSENVVRFAVEASKVQAVNGGIVLLR
jgi:hypothetical protein